MHRFATSQKGFTFVEMLLILGILTILFTVATFSLFTTRARSSLTSTVDIVVADLKQQQTNAMSGSASTGSTHAHGIYFSNTSYTLFTGSAYSASNSGNVIIPLPEGEEIETTAPSQTIIFNKVSGEVNGLSSGQYTITIQSSSSNTEKNIQLNKYGVVTQVQ